MPTPVTPLRYVSSDRNILIVGDAAVGLHRVTMYGEGMMLIERVGGGHEGHPIRKSPTNAEPSEMCYKTVHDRVLPSSLELKSTRS